MPAGLIFHHGESIPLSLRGLPPGVQEKVIDGVGLHVLAGNDADGDYVVVDHASDYEKIEFVVYSMIGIGVLGFLTLSLFLGRYVARRFVNPISLLSASVLEMDFQSELPLLSNTDEIGVLARAFAARTAELNRFLLRAEIGRCQPLLLGKPVALEFVADFDFSVFARCELLASAVGNLIRNACQYTEEGSVVIRLVRHAVMVEDTGPGIPAPIRARLTDGTAAIASIGSAGSGLGLALVKRICEHLGATLRVSEHPSGGSVFSIEFPKALTKS